MKNLFLYYIIHLFFLSSLLAMHEDDLKGRPYHLLGYGIQGSVLHYGDQVFIGQSRSSLNNGIVYVYFKDDNGNYSSQQIKAPISGTDGYQFGYSIAAFNDYLVIGAPNIGPLNGKVFLYQRNADRIWQFNREIGFNLGKITSDFGSKVIISKDHILIADRFYENKEGAVIGYYLNSDKWYYSNTLRGVQMPDEGLFGHSMDINLDTAIIGSRSANMAIEFSFDPSGRTWKVQDVLTPKMLQKEGRFGYSVKYINGQLAIGYPGYGQKGEVQIFSMNNGDRTLTYILKYDKTNQEDFFGAAIATNNEQLAIGNFNGEEVVLYDIKDDQSFQFHSELSVENSNGSKFGRALSFNSDQLIVGAVYAETSYLFKRDENNNWDLSQEMQSKKDIPSILNDPQPCTLGNINNYYPDLGLSNDLYPCSGIDMLSYLNPSDLGGYGMNDIWGWTDPLTGKEIVLAGLTTGTSFIDISDPENPVVLGFLPSDVSISSVWRDMKVYKDHIFIVADYTNANDHGIQIFDLRQLRDVSKFTTFENTAHYDLVGSVHNIGINEETGYAYAMGISSAKEDKYRCGVHMIDINDPTNPAFAGCAGDITTGRYNDGYVHDGQFVIYKGPDSEYQGKEIAFTCNETALGITDITDKSNPAILSKYEQGQLGYVHQGWLSEDQRYFFVNDELNEYYGYDDNQTMLIFDVSDLDEPKLVSVYESGLNTIDHNNFVVGDRLYQSNYSTGLRVLDIKDPLNPKEIAFFDTYPASDIVESVGSWGNYPYFKSKNIPVTSIDEGLYILKINEGEDLSISNEELLPQSFELYQNFPNPFNPMTKIGFRLSKPNQATLTIFDLKGKEVEVLYEGNKNSGYHSIEFNASSYPSGVYIYQLKAEGRVITKKMSLIR